MQNKMISDKQKQGREKILSVLDIFVKACFEHAFMYGEIPYYDSKNHEMKFIDEKDREK